MLGAWVGVQVRPVFDRLKLGESNLFVLVVFD